EANASSLYVIKGNGYLTALSYGFKPYSSDENFTSNQTKILLEPKRIKLEIFTFPANATVSLNGNVSSEVNGIATFSILPGMISITIIHKYFKEFRSTEYIYPGINESLQITMIPEQPLIAISGMIMNSKYNFGVSGVLIKYNSSDYSFSYTSGFYRVFVPSQSQNVSFRANFYAPYNISENSTANTTINVKLSFILNPSSTNGNPILTLDRAIPLLFFSMFTSWTIIDAPAVDYFEIHYYILGTSKNFTVKVGSGSSYDFVNGIYPGTVYVIYIEAIFNNGQYVFSNGLKVSYSNLAYLALNLSIAVIIGLISYSAFIYVNKRVRRKKAFDK
ncbi:xanthomonapepsin related protein, partial [mine drainage metagenome]